MANIPIACPRCRTALYPISRLRPVPRASLIARLGLCIAGAVALGLYLLGFYLVRDVLRIFIPTKLLALLLFPLAVAPGILVLLPLSRLPRAVKLRCAKCGWGETFKVPRLAQKTSPRSGTTSPRMPGLESPRAIPEPAQPAPTTNVDTGPEQSSPFERIVDDGQDLAELKARIYAEFISGSIAEDIAEDLCGQGWDRDQVEILVEEGRKATRRRRT
jgi:hypothetical protein